MPDKTVREKEKRKGMGHSLSFKMFVSTFLIWMIAGMAAQVVGLLLYTNALFRENVTLAFNVSRSAALYASQSTKAANMMDSVWRRFHSLTDEQISLMGTPEYDLLFADIQNSQEHKELRQMLQSLCGYYDVYDVYMAVIDSERSAFVYVVDPDEDELKAGYWETVEPEAVDHFLNWDGHSKLFELSNSREWGLLCTAGSPLYNEAGERAGFMLVDLSMSDAIAEMRGFVIVFTLSILAINLIATFISIHRQKKAVVEPIGAITKAAQAYREDHVNGTQTGAHFAELTIRTGDELENLSRAMKDMEQDIVEFTENLAAVTAEKERVATELNMAAGIQAHMLPNTFPAFPDRSEFSIYATMTPAKEVGGDFYDFFMLDDDHLAVVMADVSGKGVPAALFMMTARTMLRGVAQAGLDPAGVLQYVNAQICENNPEDMFVTVWLGYLEISTGKLTWADAGHEPLMLLQGGEWKKLSRKGGIALGFLEPELIGEDSPFRNQELLLKPGDAVFQYTDGVTEAMTASDELFGEDRLLRTLGSAPSTEPEKLLPYIYEEVSAFVDGAAQFDDITMLGLKYNGGNKE